MHEIVYVLMYTFSLVPGPSLCGEKGLVHTDCACASLYPESGYIVYSRKTKYLRLHHPFLLLVYGQGTHDASSNSLFDQLAGQQKQKVLSWHLFEQTIELPRGKL